MNRTGAYKRANGGSTLLPSSSPPSVSDAASKPGEPHAGAQPQQPPGAEQLLAHLRSALEASEDALVSVDLNGTIILWNRCAEALFGYSATEAIGRPAALLIPPDRAGEFASVLGRVRSGESVEHLETVRMRRDGTRVAVLFSTSPVHDESGALIGMSATIRDITQQKRIEGEMRLWRDELQAIARGVDDAVVVRGPGGEVVYANENAAHLLGFYSVADLLASPTVDTHRRFEFYTETGELVPPDRLPGIMALQGIEVPPTLMRFRLLAPPLPGTCTGSTERMGTIQTTGDADRWAMVKAVPIRDQDSGEVKYAASIFSDITERRRAEEALKESEARFQAFMHNAPIVAFMKDEHGKVVFLNHAWEQLFGTPIAEALGKDDYQLQPPDLAQQFHDADMEVLRSGSVKVMPETVTAADGTVRHWMTFKFPIVLPLGARYVGGASVEITERVRAEQELQSFADRLQRLSRQLIEAQEAERRRISRDLHDQVGQSLTAIKIDLQIAQQQVMMGVLAAMSRAAAHTPVEASNTEVASRVARVEDGGEADPVHELFAQRLGRGIEMVERTIQQVREFSLDLRPSILDDLGLPSALLWYAEEQARRAGFQARLAVEQFPTRLSPEVEITCFRVAQEAITNVVRHARASEVSVELRRRGDELVLAVTDDGAGFDAQSLASGVDTETGVGDRGGKAATAHDRIKTLGLAGMQERVMLVGGALSIQSSAGAGTTVRAVFPLAGPTPVGTGEG